MTELTENPVESGAPASTAPPATSSSPDPAGRPHTPSPSASEPAAEPPVNTSPSPVPQPSPQHERETVNDPGVIALRGMFPDYDDLILQSVLQSVGGDQERAIDALLGMSDPDYRSEAPAPVAAPQPVALSQEELDEQFARQLVMQDQQQQTEQWMQTHGTTPGGRLPPAAYQSSRPNAQQAWSPQTQQGQDRPSEFQDQFTKFAETGKKTIGNIFSKVKAKIQEFEQGRPVPGASSGAQQQQAWTPPPGPGGYTSPPQPQSQQHQAAYYDPNPAQREYVQGSASPARTPSVQGYDVTSSIASPSPVIPASTTTQQLQRQPSPQPVTVPPPQIGTTLDGGKLGLLPKRPVTLLRDTSVPNNSGGSLASKPTYHDDDEGDDDLEYAENPFESESSGGGKK